MSRVDHDYCPVYASIDLLQEKWVLHIVRSLLEGEHGFNELARAVGGANATTLSQRLERLEALGVVVKTVESTMPPRTHYQLTASGRELEAVIDAIDRWGQAHMQKQGVQSDDAQEGRRQQGDALKASSTSSLPSVPKARTPW